MLALAFGSVDELAQGLHEAAAWLGAGEHQHCSQLGMARRPEFLAGRRLLRQLIVEQGLVGPEERLSISAGGVPRAADHPDIHLSLSHRAGWVVAAVSDHPVGVDVEVVRPRNVAAMAEHVCSAREMRRLESMPAAAALQSLHQAWVLKEAAFKSGLSPHGPMEFHRLGFAMEDTVQGHAMSWLWPDGRVVACVANDFSDYMIPTPWPGATCVQRWSLDKAGHENNSH